MTAEHVLLTWHWTSINLLNIKQSMTFMRSCLSVTYRRLAVPPRAVVALVIWQLNVQLPMQSELIT